MNLHAHNHPRTHLFTTLPTHPSIHLPTYPPTYPPTYLPTHLPTYPPTYPSTHLPTYLPTYPQGTSASADSYFRRELRQLLDKETTRPKPNP